MWVSQEISCGNAISLNVGRWRHKHVVDAACRIQIRLEIVERAVFREADASGLIGVFQQPRVGENRKDFVGLVHIKIACKDDRLALGYFSDFIHHQFGSLAPCHHAHMVHVEVKIEYGFGGSSPAVEQAMTPWLFYHSELTPGADADAGRVPTEGRLVGRLVEPEIAMVDEPEFVFFVENRLILAGLFTIVAAYADVAVAVESFQHVIKLLIQYLLRTEDFGSHEIHLVTNDLATLGPLFALHAIVPVLVTDIVGADQQILGGELQECHYEQGKEEEFFHRNNVLLGQK